MPGYPWEIKAEDYYNSDLPYDTKVRDFHGDRDNRQFIADCMGRGMSLDQACEELKQRDEKCQNR